MWRYNAIGYMIMSAREIGLSEIAVKRLYETMFENVYIYSRHQADRVFFNYRHKNNGRHQPMSP